MRAWFLLLFLALLTYVSGSAWATAHPRSANLAPSEKLIWSDEFNSRGFDKGKWKLRVGNRDQAELSLDSVDVSGGALHITTFTEDGVHKTGFLTSHGLFDAKYGYYEARIKFHESPGSWCAFWLQSESIGNPVGQPEIAGVETDIVEHRVQNENKKDVSNMAVMNLHWDGYRQDHKQTGSVFTNPPGAPPLNNNWHVYALRWTPLAYSFYLDDVLQWTSTKPVAQIAEHVRLTCEVRDKSWAGLIPAQGYGPKATSTTGMDVDWVRVWQ